MRIMFLPCFHHRPRSLRRRRRQQRSGHYYYRQNKNDAPQHQQRLSVQLVLVFLLVLKTTNSFHLFNSNPPPPFVLKNLRQQQSSLRLLLPLRSSSSSSSQQQQEGEEEVIMTPSSSSSSTSNNNYADNDNILSLNRRVDYGMGGINLSTKWLQLVQNDQVAVTTTIPAVTEDGESVDMIPVRYGVRIHPHSNTTKDDISFMEFVEGVADVDGQQGVTIMHPKIAQMNQTLQRAAQLLIPPLLPEDDKKSTGTAGGASGDSSSSLQCRYDGNYVAQLQLVRTLRPPPSPGFGQQSTDDYRTSCKPPAYDSSTDSLVTGPLRLQLRPKVATIELPNSLTSSTPWDIYHNISPADVRGHFLLLPTISDDLAETNWRPQALMANDCIDLVYLTASIQPMGSLLACYNSVGAGASQNHIHCHLWPIPPIPLLIHEQQQQEEEDDDHGHSHADLIHAYKEEQEQVEEGEEDPNSPFKTTTQSTLYNNGWDCYAPSKVDSIYDFVDIMAATNNNNNKEEEEDEDDELPPSPLVEVSYLEYPCFCVQLSATGSMMMAAPTATGTATSTSTNDCSKNHDDAFDTLGNAVWKVVECLQEKNAPHNVCMINRPSVGGGSANDDDVSVDVFIFCRSRERSPNIIPASKAGASEMMGVFHCHNLQQLDELVVPSAAASTTTSNSGKGSTPQPMVQLLQDVSYDEDPMELWETIKTKLEGMMK